MRGGGRSFSSVGGWSCRWTERRPPEMNSALVDARGPRQPGRGSNSAPRCSDWSGRRSRYVAMWLNPFRSAVPGYIVAARQAGRMTCDARPRVPSRSEPIAYPPVEQENSDDAAGDACHAREQGPQAPAMTLRSPRSSRLDEEYRHHIAGRRPPPALLRPISPSARKLAMKLVLRK